MLFPHRQEEIHEQWEPSHGQIPTTGFSDVEVGRRTILIHVAFRTVRNAQLFLLSVLTFHFISSVCSVGVAFGIGGRRTRAQKRAPSPRVTQTRRPDPTRPDPSQAATTWATQRPAVILQVRRGLPLVVRERVRRGLPLVELCASGDPEGAVRPREQRPRETAAPGGVARQGGDTLKEIPNWKLVIGVEAVLPRRAHQRQRPRLQLLQQDGEDRRTKGGRNTEMLSIVVSYGVKVELVLSLGGDMAAELPFVRMHPKPADRRF
ncbi:arrestin, beta 2b isoform X2 [Phycodurus eques]|uniref:arrestin, beta 2b isoform X2 n=1 Tax=Phycodurus eques TaxID=693459 RepID=UPI002ACF0502|nr:arrestin, beta 2b isoform X2 [Phycodurus eques]